MVQSREEFFIVGIVNFVTHLSGQISDCGLYGQPVAGVENLPLGCDVDVVVGRQLPGVVDEVCVRSEVAT